MKTHYRFGPFELLTNERKLLVEGEPASLGARAFDVLLVLLVERARVVSKDELMDRVWPGLVVEEANVQVQVSALRKLLGRGMIATVPGIGYRFSGEVTVDVPAQAPPADTYLIGSDSELHRLERQLAIYGTADDLRHLALRPFDVVLDAGCGSGAITRDIARAVPTGKVVGLDRVPRYVEFAREAAAAAQVLNAEFVVGNVLALPYPDNSFDVVWSKHVLQWMGERHRAMAEMCRVLKPGGRLVVANCDGFLLQHHPTDSHVQRDVERWFDAARAHMGFDNWMGRRLPVMFKQAGLQDIHVHSMPDRAYSGFGGDEERRWNMQTQWDAVLEFSTKVFGSPAAARDFHRRFMARFSDPEVYFHASMFYVEGRKAAAFSA